MNDYSMPFSTAVGVDLALAAQWLIRGETVAVPTETVYGLAANALQASAAAKIFEVKNRPNFDPLIVHIPSFDAMPDFAENIPDMAIALARAFWPGPLTLLLPKRSNIPDLVTAGLPRVALRVPAHPLLAALLDILPFPLAAPSANPFGYVSPTTAQHVYDQLGGKIPYILDGGPASIGLESTIIGFEAGRAVVHRLGGLPLADIENIVGTVAQQLNQSSNPAAPGMLKSHYAPRKPFLLGNVQALANAHPRHKIAALLFQPGQELPDHVAVYHLTDSGDLREGARRLFALLRLLDASDADIIVAELAPDEGLGQAINDRLRRAAAKS